MPRVPNAFLGEYFYIFSEYHLIQENQDEVRPGGTCAYQLLSITNDIYNYFDMCLELKEVSLDI